VDLNLTIREEIAWRPPDGADLLVRGLPDGKAAYGLFLVRADGSDLRPVTPLDGGTPNYHYLTWSPDGRRVAYSGFPNKDHPARVHILTIEGLRDAVLTPDVGSEHFAPPGCRTERGLRLWSGEEASAWRPPATSRRT
jgi:hypothetical protein